MYGPSLREERERKGGMAPCHEHATPRRSVETSLLREVKMNRRRFAVAVLITVVAGMIPFTVTAKDKFTVGYANLADSDVWLKKLKTDFTETAKSDPSL